MSRSSSAVNAGQKWTQEEDEELLQMLLSDPDAQYETMAEHFKRTPGSVQNRALNLILIKTGPDDSLESMCEHYNVDYKEMAKYKAKKDNRIQARRDARRQQQPRQVSSGRSGGGNYETDTEVLSVLKDIRSYMKILLDKLEDYKK